MRSKITAVKNYRIAKGLCFMCGEKYNPTHKCATTAQLHVVEELLAMLQYGEYDKDSAGSDQEEYEDAISDAKEVCYSINKQAITGGTETLHSMRLLGENPGP